MNAEAGHRCLFCRSAFPANGKLQHFPHARRIAFDPIKGRLWAVCDSCWRWTLWPMEERGLALDELERTARDGGKLVARTANVSLLHAGEVMLIRVGEANLVEQSWWRYGRELRSRRASMDSTGSRLAAYTWGAFAWASELIGFSDGEVTIDWKDQPRLDILRWRRFGWAAWHGRETCAYCRSTLRALRYDLSWWVYPLEGEGGALGLGVPCPRCDPWTPDNVYVIQGPQAETALRRVLAYQNISGAPEARIMEAAGAIEASGSTADFTRQLARGRESLWRMRGTRALALEIALSDNLERRLLDREIRAIDFIWQKEEELAAIIDEELTPMPVRRGLLGGRRLGSV